MVQNLTFGQKVLYFLLTIVFLGGTGIWLPLTIDFFPKAAFSLAAKHSIVSNLQTFYLGLFAVSVIDRILYLLEDATYKHKIYELLISAFVIIAFFVITYFVFQNIHSEHFGRAFFYALLATLISFAAWWRANHVPKTNAYGALGNKNAA